MRLFTKLALPLFVILGTSCSELSMGEDPGSLLVIELKDGPVLVKLRPDLAPKHVERVKQLAKEGFYDGIKFHRVIDGFMALSGSAVRAAPNVPRLKGSWENSAGRSA